MVAPASVNTGLEDDSSNGAAVGLSEGASSLEEGVGCSDEDSWKEFSKVDCTEDCSVGEGCSVVCSWKVVGSAVGSAVSCGPQPRRVKNTTRPR